MWIRIRRAGIPKVRKARASPETSVQDSVSRSFLTRLEGCAGPGEIVMPVAATGVQACGWRLVGVARQFEVYCVGLPRAETRAGMFAVRYVLNVGRLFGSCLSACDCLLAFFSIGFIIDNQPSSGSVQAADLRPPFLGILLGWHRESDRVQLPAVVHYC